VKSKVALFADLVEWAKKNMPREPRNGPNTIADLFSTIAFKNFRIKGDKATAEVVVEGKSGRLPQFEFRRIDRKWYVHCDFMAAASIDRAALDVRSLQIAMQLYSADHGGQFLKSRKASQQALFALTKSEKLPNGVTLKPYLSKRLKDPWGNIYYYQYPHPKFPNGNFPGIWSAGPDGKSGTKDDIANWNLKRN
jgi:general secretion pathway protein G